MLYHSHKLNSTHSHIIARKDPITGDSVKENDRVVFCAACKSCFLEDSWKYMNEQHCQQSQTLETIPALPSKIITKKRQEKMISELKDLQSLGDIQLTLFFIIAITSGFTFYYVIETYLRVGAIFLGFLIGIFTGMGTSVLFELLLPRLLTSNAKFRHIVGIGKNDVRLFYTHIEMGKNSFSWNDVVQIKFQRSSYSSSVLIYLKSGQLFKKDFSVYTPVELRNFLSGFEQIPRFVEIYFCSLDRNEHNLFLEIKEKSDRKIEIVES